MLEDRVWGFGWEIGVLLHGKGNKIEKLMPKVTIERHIYIELL